MSVPHLPPLACADCGVQLGRPHASDCRGSTWLFRGVMICLLWRLVVPDWITLMVGGGAVGAAFSTAALASWHKDRHP